MIKAVSTALKVVTTLALGLGADLCRAETPWAVKCEGPFSCSAETSQCDLSISIFGRATTQGSWIGILGVPPGWDKVTFRVQKGNVFETRTINGPQLPRMAFGDASLKELMLAGESAELSVFSGGQVLKSCHLSLEGLSQAYRDVRNRL